MTPHSRQALASGEITAVITQNLGHLARSTLRVLRAKADNQPLDKELTLCRSAWDPANALVEPSKDSEAQSGNRMTFECVPWPNFADRMLYELKSGGQLCDLMIGDSQWIGGAEAVWYVKPNDFFAAEGIAMGAFVPATVTGQGLLTFISSG